MQTINVSLVKA